jgi:hypothetical protein
MAGTVVAVDMSLGSAVRMASPVLGTYALSSFGYSWTCIAQGAVLLALAVQQQLLGSWERGGSSRRRTSAAAAGAEAARKEE